MPKERERGEKGGRPMVMVDTRESVLCTKAYYKLKTDVDGWVRDG